MAALVRTSFVICSALILLTSPGVRAGTAQHHGLAVNGEAGYEECLACHDGVLAPSVSPCLASVCMFRGPHPVARAYPPPDKIDQFASREEVERAGIRLLNGQTDCISCHDLFGAKRYHLRFVTDGSRLCFACHRK